MTYAYDTLDRVLSMAWKEGDVPDAPRTGPMTYSPRGQRVTATELNGRVASYG